MTKITEIITKLSSESQPLKPMKKPGNLTLRLLLILGIYAIIAQIIMGVRADLISQLDHPLFVLEITLALLLFISGVVAAIITIYPDLYQKSQLLKIPYLLFFLLLALFAWQFFIAGPTPIAKNMQLSNHSIECSLSITLLAFIPAIIIITILQKGATITPLQAGLFTTLSASSLGYLILRLQEINNSLPHLLTWHYLPMILLALAGALIGRRLFRW